MSKRETVALQNLEPRMTVYNLAHPEHTRVRKIPQVQELKNGRQVGVFVKKRLPTSITFLARERKFRLKPSILMCPEIKAAIEAHPPRLRILSDVVVDRSQRPARPVTKPAKKKPKTATSSVSLSGQAKTEKD